MGAGWRCSRLYFQQHSGCSGETSTNLDIATHTLGFFLDNVIGGGQGEWSSGNIALLKVFDTALTSQQVAAETADPFQGTGTPEPGTWGLIVAGAVVLALRRRFVSPSPDRA